MASVVRQQTAQTAVMAGLLSIEVANDTGYLPSYILGSLRFSFKLSAGCSQLQTTEPKAADKQTYYWLCLGLFAVVTTEIAAYCDVTK